MLMVFQRFSTLVLFIVQAEGNGFPGMARQFRPHLSAFGAWQNYFCMISALYLEHIVMETGKYITRRMFFAACWLPVFLQPDYGTCLVYAFIFCAWYFCRIAVQIYSYWFGNGDYQPSAYLLYRHLPTPQSYSRPFL